MPPSARRPIVYGLDHGQLPAQLVRQDYPPVLLLADSENVLSNTAGVSAAARKRWSECPRPRLRLWYILVAQLLPSWMPRLQQFRGAR